MDRWTKAGKTIGAGGQAQVFVVRDSTTQLDGDFALKVLTNRNRAARLDLEISTMNSLARTGVQVIPIIDDYTVSEPDTQRPWYVMPIANQGSLKERIAVGKCFGDDEGRALALFADVVDAVRGVHQNGVAHRDLKPANILLHDERVLLCDLGLCLPLAGDTPEERLTGELERIGSVHYMPKEAFGRRPIDTNQYALDAYALGKILYELLAGKTLPGFIHPNDPQFDLHKLRQKPVYMGVNGMLRNLLSDDPSVRLATLETLKDRVKGLQNWASAGPTNTLDDGMREKLSEAGEALARALAITPPPSVSADFRSDCESLNTQIMALWEHAPAVKHVEEILLPSVPGALQLQKQPTSQQLRQLVEGPYIKSHSALEPLQDLGYPQRPDVEVGCAVGIVPGPQAAVQMAQIWMGCLIAIKGKNLYVGFALAKRESGIDAYSDLLRKTEHLIKGARDDPTVLMRAMEYASSFPPKFVDSVAADLAKISEITK